ncbi:tetratricopeptide repeat protein [Uliginosibacterium sp. H3]|uniref:Tetratricopeptide repeat protein n=1 Tax=Uliginosibacterium silvisoli TaxID=3114758 RepID=A0ABU6K8V8_9RHOO|nr:tetratricopeptide repeat protein [Uliginosibacterium sp. H3]
MMLGTTSIAFGASLQEAQNLLRQGQQAKALDEVNELVSASPKDRQARFLKGVILAEMNRLDEAATVFTKLTEEAPELPEPYNNLAVIYAQQKQYDKARTALEMSIRTHPTYATAHENLGDLYTQMARQAYDRALQIDSSNSNAQTKLKMLREIMSVGGRTTAPTARPTTVASAASSSITAPAPTPAPVAAPAPAPTPAPAKPLPAPAPAPTPAPVAKPTPAPEKPVEKPAAKEAQQADVQKTIEGWAAAWSRKDVKGYLAVYAKDFDVPGNASRKSWEDERESRIAKPGNIKVGVTDLKVQIDGDQATARFRQHYSSATLNTTTSKTLVLVQRGNRWLIQQERVGR